MRVGIEGWVPVRFAEALAQPVRSTVVRMRGVAVGKGLRDNKRQIAAAGSRMVSEDGKAKPSPVPMTNRMDIPVKGRLGSGVIR